MIVIGKLGIFEGFVDAKFQCNGFGREIGINQNYQSYGWRKNGKFNGNGEFKDYQGNYYKGQFKNGQKNGEGKITYAGMGEYQGEWLNDQMNGRGM